MIRFFTLISAILLAATAAALPAGHFAQHSVLAEGHWVKVSVPESGLYCITPAQLRSWGFSGPENVRVHGYGSRRMPDRLEASTCIDDLPQVQTVATSRGLVFYAVGADETVASGDWFTVTRSPYATEGYYYLSETGAPARDIPYAGVPEADEPAESFTQVLHHELDATAPAEIGAMLVGEEFRLTPRRTFAFDAPGCIAGAPAWLQCSFVAVTPSASSYVNFAVNGESLPRVTADRIDAMPGSNYQHAMMTVTDHSFKAPDGTRISVELSHSSPSSAVYNAWLNYLTVCYTRRLELPAAGALAFQSYNSRLRLRGATADTEILDVTDPLDIKRMRAGHDASGAVWTNDYTGLRRYVAFTPAASLPSPALVHTVPNTDLHATPAGTDMVILTPPELRAAAERLAALHRAEPDNMQVVVADLERVYDEFGSGAADVSAIRKYLKMLYDRGTEAGHAPAYALLMGRPTYDHRRLTAEMKRAAWPVAPAWITRADAASLNDNSGFTTDDFIAMLADGSGADMSRDNLDIAVGRIPAASADEASSFVDKIEQYMHKSARTPWKNIVVALADDDDNNVHMLQTEDFVEALMAAPGQQHVVDKIYTEAYPLVSGGYQQARDDMFRRLQDGAVWWNYVGHATTHSWTGEKMLTYTDINNLLLRNVPFIYAATCDFLRWDSNTASGGEILLAERNGGCIGIISATRPAYISDNGNLTRAMGHALAMRGADGRYMRVGDIYRHAKNNQIDGDGNIVYNTNRLRYSLGGDPALRLATPSNVVRIDSIDGVPFRPEEQPTLAALQQAVISGHIEAPDGTLMAGFDGTATIELFDAEHSMTTLAHKSDDEEPFEVHGNKLLSVSAPVSGGRFSARVAMPADISDNFRPATLNVYAGATAGTDEAIGVCRDIYVYGIDDSAAPDTEAPAIDSYLINHSGFRSGDRVSTRSPMVLASLSDNVGINISSAGVGHQLTLTLDSATTYSNVAQYYTPHPDGTPGGTIAYPLPDMERGLHILRLRVWDTSGNAAEQTLEFFADTDVAPQIFELYTDANPARTAANFYITHDAPEAMATVTVTVYNLLGQPVWTRTERGRSDMFTSTPVTWDLRDGSGRRVERGIYVYSATITVDGTTHRTASRKLAVSAY